MTLYRKKPVAIDAVQWFLNGDHPDDLSDRDNNFGSPACEGMVVRYYYYRAADPAAPCNHCGNLYAAHGWINTLEGGHIVCPGDWIITGVNGERYPCKPDIFEKTYEAVK